ncbi:hypothetical protein GCM10023187_54470 [Nibrella viscosa]|uniref:Uncharacterized protein n=1 Tax=Nibrella viscosa TaxID=1084524 RepID=A0ABP8KZJ5_9BACT
METGHQNTIASAADRRYTQYPTPLAGEGQKLTREEKKDLSRLIDEERYPGNIPGPETTPGTGTSLGNNDGTQVLPDSNDIGEAAPGGNNFGERPPGYNDQERWNGR